MKRPTTELDEERAAGRALKRLHAAMVADLQAANASHDTVTVDPVRCEVDERDVPCGAGVTVEVRR